ncbi:MAG: CRISPR-associated endonuclease Cas1 [Actinomycetota bacterium]
MQSQTTAQGNALSITPSGVLFVSGFASSLRVERSHLIATSGQGRNIRGNRFPRLSRPRIRRVIVYGKGGYATWDALEWIDGIGASFAQLSRDGRVITSSGRTGPNQPALRRAQVSAGDTEVGTSIVRSLLDQKLRGQLAVLQGRLANDEEAATVENCLGRLHAGDSVSGMSL